MKISLNKIRYAHEHYGPEGLADGGVDELVKKIGSQLGEVEAVIDLNNRFESIIIAEVVSCVDHPNADRLHLCKIDDGGKAESVERDKDGLVQVVCGANNVRDGLMVAWLPPGSTVPESRAKDPFVLEVRELRGIKSNGMLASPRELTIGDNHDGILEVDVDVAPGTSFAEAYRTEGDVIIDIENKMFTHRPDCFGTMGVIREIAGIQGKPFKSPDWYKIDPDFPSPEAEELKLTVVNELPELVPRFAAVVISGVEIKPSSVWLQIYLSELGVRPINNVVDYTNYWMLETGQPLHAYDYDKLKSISSDDGASIVIRHPRSGERIELLNGKTVEPRAEAIMIATDKQLIGIGGIMGGGETEIDDNTKNIVLECATFDMYSIRKSSMAHGLFTDAVTRFNKGQSPLQNLSVLAKIVESMQSIGSKVASPLIDINQVKGRQWIHPPVTVTVEFVNNRLGLKLSAEEMKVLLENVEFQVESKDITTQKPPLQGETLQDAELEITAPFWRTDIEIREDVVEEIGRLYGFDKLPLELPQRSITPGRKDDLLELKAKIRARLARAGANEVLTYSFIHGKLLENVSQDPAHAFKLSNALSPDLQYYRLSLTPSLLDKVHMNVKAGYSEFALFELGKTHINTDSNLSEPTIPDEKNRLAFVYSSKTATNGATAAPYYTARKYLSDLMKSLGLVSDRLRLEPLRANMHDNIENLAAWFAPFERDRSALIFYDLDDPNNRSTLLGVIGEFTQLVHKTLKLPAYVAGFELDTAVIQAALMGEQPSEYRSLPRFPKVTQDITLKVAAELPYQELRDLVWEEFAKVQPDQTLPKLSPRGIYQAADDTEHKQITFRLEIASYDRTLTDQEVNKLLDEVTMAAKAKFNAERI
ncbi:MAG: phenylalanine--tRNA ligase subunit beta [Candidatus Saccharimonadales bacterium]